MSRATLAEISMGVAILAGWTLVTWGVAEATRWWVWPVSGGLLLFGIVGFRMVAKVVMVGFYVLAQDKPIESREDG